MQLRPVIKIWCLPKSTEEELQNLHRQIVELVRGVRYTDVTSEEDLIVLFPSDLMSHGLGFEIFLEVYGGITPGGVTVWHEVADKLALLLKSCFPSTRRIQYRTQLLEDINHNFGFAGVIE